MLPLLGFVVGILGTREESCREGISTFSGLLVDDKDGLGSDHQDSDFSLLDSWQELHVNQHALIPDDVFFAEVHVLSESSVLDVVVNSFSALDLGVKREHISGFIRAFVFNLNSPDALTSRSSVLLENTFSVGQSLGEAFLEVRDVIVDIGIFWDEAGLVQLDEGRFGSKADHGIGVAHANKASC